MISLSIFPDGDGQFAQLRNKVVHQVQDMSITGLQGGMVSGAPSVALIIPLDDGSFVFAQTTLKLFLTAADVLKARHGDPREHE